MIRLSLWNKNINGEEAADMPYKIITEGMSQLSDFRMAMPDEIDTRYEYQMAITDEAQDIELNVDLATARQIDRNVYVWNARENQRRRVDTIIEHYDDGSNISVRSSNGPILNYEPTPLGRVPNLTEENMRGIRADYVVFDEAGPSVNRHEGF